MYISIPVALLIMFFCLPTGDQDDILDVMVYLIGLVVFFALCSAVLILSS